MAYLLTAVHLFTRLKGLNHCEKHVCSLMYFVSLTPIVFFSCLQRNIPRYPALRHHYPPGALCKTGVSLFKKYYSTECYIRSSKQESGLAKMNHQLSHHVKQRSPGTHSTSWHFTQSKKTHTRLNTDRSIT